MPFTSIPSRNDTLNAFQKNNYAIFSSEQNNFFTYYLGMNPIFPLDEYLYNNKTKIELYANNIYCSKGFLLQQLLNTKNLRLSTQFETSYENNETINEYAGINSSTSLSSIAHSGIYSYQFSTIGTALSEPGAYHWSKINSSDVYVIGFFNLNGSLEKSNLDDRFYFLRLRNSNSSTLASVGIWAHSATDSVREQTVNNWVILGYEDGNKIYRRKGILENFNPDHWYKVTLHWRRGVSDGILEVSIDNVNLSLRFNSDKQGDVTNVEWGIPAKRSNAEKIIVYADDISIYS